MHGTPDCFFICLFSADLAAAAAAIAAAPAAACGSGVEPGCEIHSGAIKTACQNDARKAWRGAVTRIDREGNLVWYRLDSFQDNANEAGESASEYIFQDNAGRIVSVTDEGFGGFGFLTYEGN